MAPDPIQVSVVMNFLNEERFIEAAIASVYAQSHGAWELLLVDDGSTDASTAIARRHAARDPGRVRYLEHAGHVNHGVSVSRNLGLAAATSPYVAFLDADDVWLPNRLERAARLLDEHPMADMVYGRTQYWFSWSGEKTGRTDWIQSHRFRANRLVPAPDLLIMYLKAEAFLPCMGSLTVRRDAALACGGFVDEFRGLYEDQAFLTRFCLAHAVYVSDEQWDRYRQHPGGMCAAAERDTLIAAREAYFTWLEAFLEQHGLRGTPVWKAAAHARRSPRGFVAARCGIPPPHRMTPHPASEKPGMNIRRPVEPRVAVIMLTFNQRDKTLRALRSLGADDWQRLSVLVWDNGSSDGTVEAVAAEFPQATVRHHASNLGVASGRNAGARLAIERFQPTHLLFLDNDLVLTPGFADALLNPFKDEQVGQTQAKLLYLNDPSRINDGGGCRINFWLGRTDPVGFREIDRGQCDAVAPCVSCGGAMMVRSDVFRALGGFDPLFDPFGPEDLDFSLRLRKSGLKALYIPQALAYHEVSHSFESGGYTATYARSKARHWLRFLRRHGTAAQKAGFLLFGAPLIALRMVFRELARGNPGALIGSTRGLIEALRDSDERR